MGKSPVSTPNPFKTMFKGTSSKVKDGMHRPEGAGNFDNAEDVINTAKEIDSPSIKLSGIDILDLMDQRAGDSALWEVSGISIEPIEDKLISGIGLFSQDSISGQHLSLITTDTEDPEIHFETTNTAHHLDIHLDENVTNDTLVLEGHTAAVDTDFQLKALTGQASRVHIIAGSNEAHFKMDTSGDLEILNENTDKDIVFKYTHAAETHQMTLVAENNKLTHSTGNFDFDDDNLITTGDISGANVFASNDIRATDQISGAGLLVSDTISGGKLLINNGAEINGGVVFNDDSADVNFRIESNTSQNMFFVDGGTGKVGINTGSPDSKFSCNGNSIFEGLMKMKATGDNSADRLLLSFQSSTSGDRGGITIGSNASFGEDILWKTNTGLRIFLDNNDSTPTDENFIIAEGSQEAVTFQISPGGNTRISGTLIVGGDTTISGNMVIKDTAGVLELNALTNDQDNTIRFKDDLGVTNYSIFHDTSQDRLKFRNSAGQAWMEYISGSKTIVINNDSVDMDLRIEGNGDINLIRTDAGNDRVGIGIGSPLGKLHIDQNSTSAAIPTLVVDQADVSEGTINFIAQDRGSIPTSVQNSLGSIRIEVNGTVRTIPFYADQ